MNKIILIGNVGQDPAIRNAQGANVATYSIAVNKRKKDANGAPIDVTTWFNCETWNKGAEFAEKFIKKGMKLFVEGELNVEKYNDKDGIEKTSIKVRVDRVEILSSMKDANAQGVQQEATIPASTETADEDLPF